MVEKFSDRFSRFDTILECDRHPASHVAVAITLNAQASSLKIVLSFLNRLKETGNCTQTMTELCQTADVRNLHETQHICTANLCVGRRCQFPHTHGRIYGNTVPSPLLSSRTIPSPSFLPPSPFNGGLEVSPWIFF